MIFSIQDSLPVRYRAVHVVNHSVIVDVFLPMVKIFASKKLRDRVSLVSYNAPQIHKI